jgi:hypothetical protein
MRHYIAELEHISKTFLKYYLICKFAIYGNQILLATPVEVIKCNRHTNNIHDPTFRHSL